MKEKHAPGPGVLEFFGHLVRLRRNPLQVFRDIASYGDLVAVPFLVPIFLLNHPDYIKHVLVDNHENYRKGPFNRRLKVLLGEGLLTSEGPVWRQQRQLTQPVFARERLAAVVPLMTRRVETMLADWERDADAGRSVDMHLEMTQLAATILGDAILGVDLARDIGSLPRTVSTALSMAVQRMLSFMPLPLWLPTRANRGYREVLRTLDDLVDRFIEERRKDGKRKNDLLTLLMEPREDAGRALSNRELRDQIMTILLAGHETTAVALSWFWYLLAQHPAVEANLEKEVMRVLNGRTPTSCDLDRLTYLAMVFQETMRLYPPVWSMHRQAIHEGRIDDYCIPSGATVFMSPYLLHRHPSYWPDPDRFDPDRFLPERSAGRPRFAYLPFAAGPRQCIGAHFAALEAQLVIAMVLQRYRLRLVSGEAVNIDGSITLRPANGIRMVIENRRDLIN